MEMNPAISAVVDATSTTPVRDGDKVGPVVDDTDRRGLGSENKARHCLSPEGHRAEAAPLCADMGGVEPFDVDSYAAMIYRANLEIGLADAQIEYSTTPELQDLLTRASEASTVRRRRLRRT